ncbi:MAG: hypothetical protein ACYS0I_11035 [Planctomycetota bacterium]|jgi:hypothetical protein
MKREDINYVISLLLLFSICITGMTGYIQSQLELRKFVPHRYFAYATLCLAAVHVYLNVGKLWRYICRKFGRKRER